MHPARHIEASNAEAGRIFDAILTIVLAGSAEMHPDARLREADGAMSLHCVSEDTSRPLVRMPRDLLVPIDGAVWADGAEELRLESPPPGLTPVQRDLLDLHVALYNATGKIPWVAMSHPAVALVTHPDLVAAIVGVRPAFVTGLTPAEAFLSTRTFRLKPRGADAPSGKGVARALLPVIDLANHHPLAARLDLDERWLAATLSRPGPTDECFINYGGRRDALDLALHYGYVDSDTPLARSAPVLIDIPRVGALQIESRPPKRAHALDPPSIDFCDGRLTLSHLTFDSRHPDRALASLGLAVRARALSQGLKLDDAEDAALAAFSGIVEANRQLLKVAAGAGLQVRELPAAATVAAAASRLAEIVGASTGT